MTALMRTLAALACGTVFGFGLSLSGMVDPARVRGFLDVTGRWDPRLAFVLGGAVCVAMIGYRITSRCRRPAFDEQFHLPTNTKIDQPLLIGMAIFGIGWGIAGFCPGPALASLSLGVPSVVLFAIAMITGMVIHDRALGACRIASGRTGLSASGAGNSTQKKAFSSTSVLTSRHDT